ncbi:TonB-dependent receptor [Mangrovivirga cuniculi]|uniref:TonB-dependent receptor n=1 Tax=Mangrovivirga cuniculi TaxID=2715131 RepID=A0A4D7JYD6_9BACT|nr:TonB-dependent receptor [Mangrovivirga cuniculi]QCK15705.1 hypothetical protein DCC35_13605 [Mangrovivirga cuniculi]
MNRRLLPLFLILFPLLINAQKVTDIYVDTSDNGKLFTEFLEELKEEHGVVIAYEKNDFPHKLVYGIQSPWRLVSWLEEYIPEYHVFTLENDQLVIISREEAGYYAKRKENYILLKGSPGKQTTVTGTVIDKSTNETVVGAQVTIPSKGKGKVTDVNGKFSLKTTPGFQILKINFVGFDEVSYILCFDENAPERTITTEIFPESIELDAFVVTASRPDQNVRSEMTGIQKMTIESIKSLPTFLGEVDPIRSMTSLPGVSTTGELASGFNVRGGETGQNLILQDEATIYNPAHLFGFFSAFNPDMVSNVSLYKGGGPAEYGSRISSVLDVSLRNGDAGRFKVSGGVGLVSSRLTLEGPIVKNKSSYIVGGRMSYTNWLLRSTNDVDLNNSSAQFYDVTARIFHTIDENNIITLTLYNSYDDFSLASDSVFSWQTFNASAVWDRTYNEKMNSSLSLASSNYNSQVTNVDELEGFTYKNKIRSLHAKYKIQYEMSEDVTFSAGAETERVFVEPGILSPLKEESNVLPADMQDQRALESAVFVQANFPLTDKLSISTGLRYSHFLRFGPEDIYEFDFDNMNGRYPSISDTLSYSNGEVIKSFGGLEPRVSFRYLLTDDLSLKASYFRTIQYLHMVSNTTSTTPQDYWISSGPYLKPSTGDQFSLGFFKNFGGNMYETSVEGFYKTTKNAVDYIDGAEITLNPALEAGLLQGDGLAYGLEMLVKKNKGTVSGWIAYTYSRSLRRFNGQVENRILINDGKYYAAVYDQPHNLSVVSNFKLGPRTTLSANFNYSTGRPITIPVSKFSYGPYLSVLNYSERNKYRIPDYHRLDLSLTIADNPTKNKRFHGEWVFSIYNVYGRKNAYSIVFDKYGKAKKISILGSVFPSINYNFNF